jgi:hypothetical protein
MPDLGAGQEAAVRALMTNDEMQFSRVAAERVVEQVLAALPAGTPNPGAELEAVVEGNGLVECPRCGRPNKTTREWPGSICDACGRELGVPEAAPAGLTRTDAKELLECVRIVPPMARPNPSLLRRLRSLASLPVGEDTE